VNASNTGQALSADEDRSPAPESTPRPSVTLPPDRRQGDDLNADAAADPAPQGGQTRDSVTEVLPRVFRIVGAVVAPTTLLTGLLFYFGRLHVTGMFRYLGVNFTVLDLTFQDYLIRSADGLFVPLAAAAFMVLLLVWAHGLAIRALGAGLRRRAARLLLPVVLLAALVLLATAVAGLRGSPAFVASPEIPGLALAIGTLLLAYATHLLHESWVSARPRPGGPLSVAEWGAVFVVVSVGLFWAVGSYAIGVGTSRGQQIERELPSSPDTVLYSEKRLNLHATGVTETDCPGDDTAYRFRYDGLKLVLQSGGQYLFLPTSWTRADGSAIVIPRTDALRLEFSAPGRAQVGTC
jgi:hypothetical protein